MFYSMIKITFTSINFIFVTEFDILDASKYSNYVNLVQVLPNVIDRKSFLCVWQKQPSNVVEEQHRITNMWFRMHSDEDSSANAVKNA